MSNSVWFKFTPAADTPVEADTLLSSYDTILTVVTGTTGSFTPVACNDNAGTGAAQVLQSQVFFNATGGTTYYFMVSSVLGDGGITNFHLSLTSPPGTANLTLAPSPTVTFAATAVGSASAPQTITVTNNGPGSVTLSNINTSGGNTGDFIGGQQATDCQDGHNNLPATVLALNASCVLHGQFTPTGTGLRQTTLTKARGVRVNWPSARGKRSSAYQQCCGRPGNP